MKTTAFVRKYWQEFLTVLMFLVWAGGFMAIGWVVDIESTHHLGLAIDDKIPLIPEFSLIYLGLFPVFFMPFLMIKDDEYFKIFSGAYLTIMVIAYTVFFFFPVSIVRPTVEVTDFSTWVLNIIYACDRPVNLFPSTHVAMTMMAALTIWEINRLYGLLAGIYAAAIAASTLFTKQHYFLDVVIAIVLTFVIYHAFFKQRIMIVVGRRMRHWEKYLDRYYNDWVDDRLTPLIDRLIDRRVNQLDEKPDNEDNENASSAKGSDMAETPADNSDGDK